jgi:hypothetical protein
MIVDARGKKTGKLMKVKEVLLGRQKEKEKEGIRRR